MFALLVPLLFGATVGQVKARPVVASIAGDLRIFPTFHSSLMSNDRAIRVWLPPGYATEIRRRYPVLYMNDGQNLFDATLSPFSHHEWRCDETAFALIKAKLIEPIIIVGIDNAGADRGNEYLPSRVNGMGGKADLYGQFVVSELKPFIDKEFRTKPDRADTALGGSSFGGVVSLYLGLKRPDVFSKILVVSPSIWWDNRMMLGLAKKLPSKLPLKIWLDIGTAEDPNSQKPRQDADALDIILVSKGWVAGKDLAYFVDFGARHTEEAWANRFGPMLLFLFGRH